MRALLDRLVNPLHLLLALVALWLLASSPWLGMIRRVPPDAGAIDLAHVALGFVVLALAAVYLVACVAGGRWRLYFPWLGGGAGAVGRDLAGLLRGQRPMSEGGGLFGALEGLLLVALLATAASGAAWFALQNADGVLAARTVHVVAARTVIGLLVLHALGVSLHVIDLVRD